MKQNKLNPEKTKVIIQGFGNAGSFAAEVLHSMGFIIVGISDSKGGIYNPKGIDPFCIIKYKKEKGSVIHCTSEGKIIKSHEILEKSCDILVLAAMENQITNKNKAKIKTKIILELANGPTTLEADEYLAKKGVVIIPDILANAGGVTVSYFEWLQNQQAYYWPVEEIHAKLKRIMIDALNRILSIQQEYKCTMREAAYISAFDRLEKTLKLRGSGAHLRCKIYYK